MSSSLFYMIKLVIKFPWKLIASESKRVRSYSGTHTPLVKWLMTRPSRFLTSYFFENIRDRNVKFWYNLHSRLLLVLSKFRFDIFDSLETMRFSERNNFIIFFIITFDWNGNFEFWLLHRKDLAQCNRSQVLLIIVNIKEVL